VHEEVKESFFSLLLLINARLSRFCYDHQYLMAPNIHFLPLNFAFKFLLSLFYPSHGELVPDMEGREGEERKRGRDTKGTRCVCVHSGAFETCHIINGMEIEINGKTL
jgi:hypothetical protein